MTIDSHKESQDEYFDVSHAQLSQVRHYFVHLTTFFVTMVNADNVSQKVTTESCNESLVESWYATRQGLTFSPATKWQYF